MADLPVKNANAVDVVTGVNPTDGVLVVPSASGKLSQLTRDNFVSSFLATDIETIAGTATNKPVTPAGLKAALPFRLVRASGDTTGATDTAAIQAASDALTSPNGGTVFIFGRYYFNGKIQLKRNVNLWGAGGATYNASSMGTVLQATHADAQILFGADTNTNAHAEGGTSGNFTVDGNDVGGVTYGALVKFGYVVGRHFQAINVERSAGVGAALYICQNSTFVGCDIARNAGNGLTFDFGAAGNVFTRCEIQANTGWGIVLDETSGTAGQYPFNNHFYGLIVERSSFASSSTQGMLYQGRAGPNWFHGCQFAALTGTITSTDMILSQGGLSTSHLILESCEVRSATALGAAGLHQVAGRVDLRGRCSFLSCATAIEYDAGTGSLDEIVTTGSTTDWGGTGSPASTWVLRRNITEQHVVDNTKFGFFMRFARTSELATGDRLDIGMAGDLAWGGGAAATDVTLARLAAKVLGLGSGMAFRLGTSVTGSRVAAATAGAGAVAYDTTLAIPIYSDGTNWRKFSDNTVA